MKLFLTSAVFLLLSVNAYTPNDITLSDGDCTEDPATCETAGSVCVKRTVDEVQSASDSDYKKAKAVDADLTAGTVTFKCFPQADADTLVASSGKKESKTRVTASYVILEPVVVVEEPGPGEGEKKEGAYALSVAGGAAATLAALSMF